MEAVIICACLNFEFRLYYYCSVGKVSNITTPNMRLFDLIIHVIRPTVFVTHIVHFRPAAQYFGLPEKKKSLGTKSIAYFILPVIMIHVNTNTTLLQLQNS